MSLEEYSKRRSIFNGETNVQLLLRRVLSEEMARKDARLELTVPHHAAVSAVQATLPSPLLLRQQCDRPIYEPVSLFPDNAQLRGMSFRRGHMRDVIALRRYDFLLSAVFSDTAGRVLQPDSLYKRPVGKFKLLPTVHRGGWVLHGDGPTMFCTILL